MRTIELKSLTNVENELDSAVWNSSDSPVAHRSYHEMADRPVVELDALAQLEVNVQVLEQLHGRLGFLMREVGALLKV